MQGGEEAEWVIEGGSVSGQDRRGITSDVINVGEIVTVAGYASTRRANNMNMQNILLANGQELMLSGNGTPRWPDVQQAAITGPTLPTAVEIAEAEANADGLFRTWSWGRLERGWWFFADPDAFPLTDAALGKFAAWNEYTEFDVTRVIHLNAKPVPAAEESNMGYSVGYWEDENTLVVDTANINYPYFNRVGISSGPDLTTHERFVIDDEAGEMHYFLTINDPWTLTKKKKKEMLLFG